MKQRANRLQRRLSHYLRAVAYLPLRIRLVRQTQQIVTRQLVRFENSDFAQQPHAKRMLMAGTATVFLFSAVVPLLNVALQSRTYALSSSVSQLVGDTNKNLTSKLSFDASTDAYYFNKGAIGTQLNDQQNTTPQGTASKLMQQQVGGTSKTDKNTYSVKLPVDPAKGTTYYDNNLNLSFTLTPTYSAAFARKADGRVVYPLPGGAEAVYTPKGNGLKEDLVLNKASNDSLSFSYTLNLPKELEARLVDDGSGDLGIYSADPTLFASNISYGSDTDKASVMKARQSSEKNNLVFVIPAPVIKQTGDGSTGAANASFDLSSDGKTLTVNAEHLAKLTYPVSIDPTVVVTTTTDFSAGNDEGMIDYASGGSGVSGQLLRGASTGGTIGSWNSTSSLTNSVTAIGGQSMVAYNGYMYVLGGYTGVSYLNSVQYAPINSNGTLGSFTLNNTTFANGRFYASALAYNGYMYLVGGTNLSTIYKDVQYAQINSDGSLGTWKPTTNFATTGAYGIAAVASNGYMYAAGGQTVGGVNTATEYAPINADGTVGTWLPGTALSTGVTNMAYATYNGYLYIMGGRDNSGSYQSGVVYIKLSSSGGFTGGWKTGTSLSSTNAFGAGYAYKGYLYLYGGGNGGSLSNKSWFAQINGNGSLGGWQQTTNLSSARWNSSTTTYNGTAYILGGDFGNGTYVGVTVQYASISTPGTMSITRTSTNSLSAAVTGSAVVAYKGIIYVIGGTNSSGNAVSTVSYDNINSDGSIGLWNSSSISLPQARTGVVAWAYQDVLWVYGGNNGSTYYNNPVWLSALSGSGTFSSSYSGIYGSVPATAARSGSAVVQYNNLTYIIGGHNGASYYNDIIAVAGSPSYYGSCLCGTGANFTYLSMTTPSFSFARANLGATFYNGRIYIGGGDNGSSVYGDVQYVSVSGGGQTFGSYWTSASNTFTARTQISFQAYNDRLYVVGGSTTGASVNASSAMQSATIYSDGSIGTFTSATNSLATARTASASALVNGYLYIVGGYDGSTYYSNIQYAPLNDNGSGLVSGNWSTTTAMTDSSSAKINGTNPMVYNGYLYVQPNATSGLIRYATINANGALGSWGNATTTMPTQGSSNTTTKVFLAGGYMYTTTGDVSYSAVINSDGTLGSWVSADTNSASYVTNVVPVAPPADYDDTFCYHSFTADPPGQRIQPITTSYNGYVYAYQAAGGGYTENVTADYPDDQYAYVCYYSAHYASPPKYQYAAVSSGKVGTWQTTTGASYDTTKPLIFYNNYAYQMIGSNQLSYTLINSDGTFGTTTNLELNLPDNLGFNTSIPPTMLAYNGFMYFMGGNNADQNYYNGTPSPYTNIVWAAPINSDGTLGYLQRSNTGFNYDRANVNSVAYNGNLYVIGGNVATSANRDNPSNSDHTNCQEQTTNAGNCSDVQYAPLSSIAHVGNYSKVVNLGSNLNASANQLVTTSAKAGLGSVITTTSIGANSSGVFGITTGAANCGTQVQYVKINLTLDDSLAFSFGPSAETYSSVQDVTVNYNYTHPIPSVRLRGGAFFDTANPYTDPVTHITSPKQPLDTCSG